MLMVMVQVKEHPNGNRCAVSCESRFWQHLGAGNFYHLGPRGLVCPV